MIQPIDSWSGLRRFRQDAVGGMRKIDLGISLSF